MVYSLYFMYNLFIHIGMHKTASTSMQKLLYDNSEKISRSFYIPKSCQTSNKYINHANLFFELAEDNRYQPTNGTFQDLINEIKNIKKNIIFSSEDLSYLLLNLEKKIYFENIIKNLNFKITYICFFRNEISYFFSALKELKEHKLRQKNNNNKYSVFNDLIHFKNAVLNGWVKDDLYNRKIECKVFFDINKFKKIIEYKSIYKFMYFKHDSQSLNKFSKLFGIEDYDVNNYQLNVAHKKNVKNYLYSIPGLIVYLLNRVNIKEDKVNYLLNVDKI